MKHTSIFFYLLFTTFFTSIQAVARNPQTMIETLPAYAMAVHNEILNNTRCQTEMERFRVAVDRGELWGLRLLEVNGAAGTGFLSGDNFWVGDRNQCYFLSINATLSLSEEVLRNNSKYRNPDEEFPPFKVHFYAAQIIHNSTLQYHVGLDDEDIVYLGMCLPESCTKHQVTKMLKKVFDDRTLLIGQLYAADFKIIQVSDLTNDNQWLLSGGMIVIILVLLLLCCTIIAGTLFDLLVHQRRLRRKKEFLTLENNNTSEMKNDMEEKRDVELEGSGLAELKPNNLLEQILMSFSVYSNLEQVFRSESDSIQAIHGIKFFGMVWIIVAHSVIYGHNALVNKAVNYARSDYLLTQIIDNAPLSVDTYFYLSGFLLTMVYYKSLKKQTKLPRLKKQVHQFCTSFVKRYIRLTPSYVVMIMISMLNFTWYDKVSIFRYSEMIHVKCSKYWWRNLLYINNFFDWEDLCLSWSWYLSNDMQFFLFGMFLLILSSRYFYTAAGLGVLSFVSAIIISGYIAYSMNFIPTLDTLHGELTLMYIRPWVRISPYLMGMLTAYFLAKWNYKLHLPSKIIALYWTFAIFCNLLIQFGTLNRYLPLSVSVLYFAFSKIIWSLSVAWIVIACCTNNGGVVNKILSLKVWTPLSKLTYCAYLLNPFLIVSLFLSSAYPTKTDVLPTGSTYLGLVMISYICALIFSVTTEVPFIQILRLIVNRERRRK